MARRVSGGPSIPWIVIGNIVGNTLYELLAQEIPRIYEENISTLWSTPSEDELINIALARAYTRKSLELQRTQLGLLTRYTLSLLEPQQSPTSPIAIRRRNILRQEI